jgi:hypothetical protein
MDFSECLNHVIDLAAENNWYWRKMPATARPEWLPREKELLQFMYSLPPAYVYMLMTIMLAGSGHVEADEEVLDVYQSVSNQFRKPRSAVDYMVREI